MLIPFGKLKGRDFDDLFDFENTDYTEWLLENCMDTIKKYPDFLNELKENFPDHFPSKEEEIRNSILVERKYSEFLESDGIQINDFFQYRNLIIKIIGDQWKNSSKADLYKFYGEPEVYPFIAIIRNDHSCWGGYKIHKIYIKETISSYDYYEPI